MTTESDDQLRDELALLVRVLEAETRLQFRNSSVFGGFEKFMTKRLLRLAKDRTGPLGALCAKLAQQVASYEKCSMKGRKRLIEELKPQLDRLEQLQLPTAPPQHTDDAPLPLATPPKGSLDDPIRKVKGVGPRSGEVLESLGIQFRRDVLYHMPYRYEDRRELTPIRAITADMTCGIVATVRNVTMRRGSRGRPAIVQARVEDGTGTLTLVWFNQPYLSRILKIGVTGVFFGKMTERVGRLQMASPEFELIKPGEEQETIGRIVPFYHLARGLTQKRMRRLVAAQVQQWAPRMPENLPTELLERYGLEPLSNALYKIHLPESMTEIEMARRRLVFEELFILQTALAIKKHFFTEELPGISITDSTGMIEKFKNRLPFEFTGAQKRVLAEIQADLATSTAMSRLLQGEVGSGKTVVALAALLAAVGDGFQGAIMAPTEILAEQHFLTIQDLCSQLDVSVELLVGRMTKRHRTKALERIASGDAHIVVGTHALIQDEVHFKDLGLVVVDEQHRFGVAQRSTLRHKGFNPNLLVMTATPIPRTLCLTLYGDLDLSMLDEMPPGRPVVVTKRLRSRQTDRAYDHIEKEIGKGRQAFIVCPRIDKEEIKEGDEDEHAEARAATEIFDTLANGRFKDRKVMLLHGRLSTQEKEKVMAAVRERQCDILVSTTVVEVGVDIANATIMVILGAERFGLAQLHQLRGRVGRGAHQSTCYLVSDASGDDARHRISTLLSTTDGLKVAEADLEIRGPGEFFGTKQSGLPDLKVANIVKDIRVLESARKEAFALIKRDPSLSAPENCGIAKTLKDNFRHFIYFRG